MSITAVLDFIECYGLIAVFFLIALEYACFPLPSEVVLPFAGAFAAHNGIPFIQILLVSVLAGGCGCLICYSIGFWGGIALLNRLEHRFPKVKKGIAASRRWFEQYGSISVMVGRVLPLCRTYISIIAGVSRQNIGKFVGFSFLGISVWNIVLVGLGYQLSGSWGMISVNVKKYSFILLPVVLLLIYFVVCKIKRKSEDS